MKKVRRKQRINKQVMVRNENSLFNRYFLNSKIKRTLRGALKAWKKALPERVQATINQIVEKNRREDRDILVETYLKN